MHAIHTRVQELIQSMTVREKIAQLVSAWLEIEVDGTFGVREFGVKERPEGDRRADVLGNGIGQLTRPYGTMAHDPRQQAKGINAVQHYLVTETRLGIPAMLHEECLTGAMTRGATIFPSALNYGSSWDPSLVEAIGKAIGSELRSLGIHQGLAPVLDVARDARWGRLEETFGEDPYLCGVMGAAYVNGLQGEERMPLATLKHFIGHSASEGGRNHAPVHLGERELLNIFGLPFEMVIQHTAIGSVMPAYHDIDGIPTTCDRDLLTGLLKERWGFDGLVVSDYDAVIQLSGDHRLAADKGEAAALAFNAGLDIELPSYTVYKEGLYSALERNLVTIEAIDEAVVRILCEKERQGLFDNPYIDEGAIDLGSSEHHKLAVQAGEQSLVLLKNDGILPLPASSRIALIGPLADHPFALFGGYSPPIHLLGSMDSESCVPATAQTVRRSLETLLSKERVVYEPGCMLYEDAVERAIFFPGDVSEQEEGARVISSDTSRLDDAVACALEADVTVLVVGDLAGLFGNGTVGEGSDVSTLDLPGVQHRLMLRILETGKPVVLVLASGRPYDISPAKEKASAIIAAWLPGEGGGEAIGRTIVGLNNPQGKSTLSFPQSAGSAPYAYNHAKKAGGLPTQAEFVPLYPFGHGLSYTTFTYRDLSLDRDEVDTAGTVTLSLTVENSGERPGSEVVQLYSTDRLASIVRPVKELKGFAKVHLEAGERKRLTFTLSSELFSFIGREHRRVVEPGAIDIAIGSSSEDLRLFASFTITGKARFLTRTWQSLSRATIEAVG
ncbi:MAG: glycoside hydrolase family 3 N-terminal domain-containing protein [Sphaerochaeta sp.]|jgi:beta-xylosidase|nr:glycoside hydrolase family 3 N-terminal domain-containing protein [Sphaerochaeta sp.]